MENEIIHFCSIQEKKDVLLVRRAHWRTRESITVFIAVMCIIRRYLYKYNVDTMSKHGYVFQMADFRLCNVIV